MSFKTVLLFIGVALLTVMSLADAERGKGQDAFMPSRLRHFYQKLASAHGQEKYPALSEAIFGVDSFLRQAAS